MSVFCNLGRTPWVYRAFSYQRLFADAEKGPMQIALGQSDICEFESYMPSHAVRSLWGGSQPLQHAGWPMRSTLRKSERLWIQPRDGNPRRGLGRFMSEPPVRSGYQCPDPTDYI